MNIIEAPYSDKPVSCCSDRTPSFMEILTEQKQRLERQLAQVNDALAVIEKQPDIINAVQTLQKALRHL